MNWLEEATQYYNELVIHDEARKHHLNVISPENLQVDYDTITSVSFQPMNMGFSTIDVLEDIIHRSPNLKKISMIARRDVNWTSLCSLNLSGITDLSVSINDDPGQGTLMAPDLRSLVIFGNDYRGPLELFASECPVINFASMPNIEELYLNRIPLINPNDFKDLAKLRSLKITHTMLDNLRWLSEAKYCLQKLYIEGSIVDCAGIESQQSLEKVWILSPALSRADPILRLHELDFLELQSLQLSKETEQRLKSSSINTVVITRHDRIVQSIDSTVRSFVWSAARRILSEDHKRESGLEDLKPVQKKFFLLRVTRPLPERLEDEIRILYSNGIERLSTEPYRRKDITKEEYLKIYKERAQEYYPFLS